VKSIERISNSDILIKHIIKPNLPVLGPKYGKLIGKIKAELEKSDSTSLIEILTKTDRIILNINKNIINLDRDDLLIEKTSAPGFTAAGEGNMIIGLTTDLTDELIREGIVRDAIRQVQIIRKKAKFMVEDRINIYGTFDGPVGDAIKANKEYFYNETLTQKIIPEQQSGEYNEEITVRDWRFNIAIERVEKG